MDGFSPGRGRRTLRGILRYLETPTLAADLDRDFLGLEAQAERDQAVAALHGAYLSMPYLDLR